MSAEQNLKYIKMSGAGNDFVIFDARHNPVNLTSQQITAISSRDKIGCDQLIIIKKAKDADCLMEIYNSDGSLSAACGNATRCVASIIFDKKDSNIINIKTAAAILECQRHEDGLISVNMGIPKFNWQDIPLSYAINSQKISLFDFEFACLNIGNPHAVTFIKEDISDELFLKIGPKVENQQLFKEKTNVEFAKIISNDLIEVRVWERGAGETLACGSGACAVAILAIKHNLINNHKTTIRFKGGDLKIQWDRNNSPVIMTGGYKTEFEGEIDDKFFQ